MDTETLSQITGYSSLLLFLISGYFLPTFLASKTRPRQSIMIFILNVCLAWTLLGWIVLVLISYKESRHGHKK